MTENKYFQFLTHNMTLFHFLWVMLISRLNQGAVIGNWIKLNMGNDFFDVEIKLTIKRKPTFKDKQLLRDNRGIDLFRLENELKE